MKVLNPTHNAHRVLPVYFSVDQLYGDTLVRSSDVQGKLYYDGKFRIARAGTWRTTCLMDVSYFPFDEQVSHAIYHLFHTDP